MVKGTFEFLGGLLTLLSFYLVLLAYYVVFS